MSENNEKRYSSSTILRTQKLKEIDALYRNQIKEVYADTKAKHDKSFNQPQTQPLPISAPIKVPLVLHNSKSTSTLHAAESSGASKTWTIQEQGVRASLFLKGEGRNLENLRRQNETKELKIRELSSKCQGLIQKLRSTLGSQEADRELASLQDYSDGKLRRLQNLLKIKNEEVFFKIKLQVTNLLQEFGLTKEELTEMGAVTSEGELYSFMARRLKLKLKDFRSKEQESSFQLQKDKIMTQKQEERIHYLIETNELLRLSESKLKAKVEDLKIQLNQFLDTLTQRQHQSQQLQSHNFQLKKHNQDLIITNARLTANFKVAVAEQEEQKRIWEAREKEMKALLSSYCLEKQRLERQLEESEGKSEELIIKLKFLQQQNQGLSRELVRWRQRYEGLEKDGGRRATELQEELSALGRQFDAHKAQHNESLLIVHRSEMDAALRRVEQYQRAYQEAQLQLEEERRLMARAQEQHENRLQQIEKDFLDRVKSLQRLREQELLMFQQEHETRESELRGEFQKKEKLMAQQMQAQLRAQLAEKDKQVTEQALQMQAENDHLRREIEGLKEFLRAKEEFIKAIKHHSK